MTLTLSAVLFMTFYLVVWAAKLFAGTLFATSTVLTIKVCILTDLEKHFIQGKANCFSRQGQPC